jgi:hypothetical protein
MDAIQKAFADAEPLRAAQMAMDAEAYAAHYAQVFGD